MFYIIRWACLCVAAVSNGLCGWFWDQQMEKLIFNRDILLQHKQTIHPLFIHYFNGTVFHIPAHFPDSLSHCPLMHTAPDLKTWSDGTIEGSRQMRLGRPGVIFRLQPNRKSLFCNWTLLVKWMSWYVFMWPSVCVCVINSDSQIRV